jgi:hypothetical protein
MGQAKQRGTYEQRVAEAVVRNRELERQKALAREQRQLVIRQREAALPPVERLRIRNSRLMATAGLALAASMTLGR